MDDSRISELLDRADISDLCARYALAMDRADRALFAALWSDDAVFDCVAIGLDAHGIEDILAWFDKRPGSTPPTPEPGSAIRISGNQQIRLAGDRATGTAENASFRYTGEQLYAYSVGVYEDQFVRTSDGWRFARRTMVQTPVVAPPTLAGG